MIAACSGSRYYAATPATRLSAAGEDRAGLIDARHEGTVLADDGEGVVAVLANEDLPAEWQEFVGKNGRYFVTDSGVVEGSEASDPERSEAGQGTVERMLVYNGEIKVEVARPEESSAMFLDKVRGWGGYLQSQVDRTVTVRLPSAHFDAAFTMLHDAGRVLYEHRKTDDVTEEFVDLGIRIDNARKSRDRLVEVLQQAEKVEDVLAVEKELRRLTEEIERMEGRRKFLADRVAMATMQAEFIAVAEAPPPPKRRRQASRFAWINQIGAERVMGDF
ncbi:MAG: DUF4349 domain-containing protein [Planctomycetes bacterium]|nr:DUF4349 domain-containing protein [Planctomycetota bacterium]